MKNNSRVQACHFGLSILSLRASGAGRRAAFARRRLRPRRTPGSASLHLGCRSHCRPMACDLRTSLSFRLPSAGMPLTRSFNGGSPAPAPPRLATFAQRRAIAPKLPTLLKPAYVSGHGRQIPACHRANTPASCSPDDALGLPLAFPAGTLPTVAILRETLDPST